MYEDKEKKILNQKRKDKNIFSDNNYRKSSIKTYKDFAVKALEDKPTSLAQMIIQEKKKKENQQKYSIKNKSNIFKLFISVLLIVLGLFAIGSIIFFTINKRDEVSLKNQVIEPNSLIFYDYKSENSIDGLSSSDILNISRKNRLNSNIPIGDIKIFYFTKKDKNGYKVLANAQDFFNILDTRAPYQFKRNLKGPITTGILSTSDGQETFMIIEMMNFDSSYAHILSWEKNMMFDMGKFFGVNKKYYSQKFVDVVLYNKDARVILDEEGYVVFGYSFIESNKLLFFTSNNQFRNLIEILLNEKTKK